MRNNSNPPYVFVKILYFFIFIEGNLISKTNCSIVYFQNIYLFIVVLKIERRCSFTDEIKKH